MFNSKIICLMAIVIITTCLATSQAARIRRQELEFQSDIGNQSNSEEDSGEDLAPLTEENNQTSKGTAIKSLLGEQLQRLEKQPQPRDCYDSDGCDYEEDDDPQETYDPYNDNFYDLYPDGTYIYGYSLPHGVRRYERSFYSEKYKGLVVEGFYTEMRHYGHRVSYELRCYRADSYGYRPLPVKFLRRPPVVQRDTEPDVDCFN